MSTYCNKVFKLRSLFCGPKFDLKVGIILRMLSALNLANNGIFFMSSVVSCLIVGSYQISFVKTETYKLRT